MPIRREESTFDSHCEAEDELGPVEPRRLPAKREHPEEQGAGDDEREVEATVRNECERALRAIQGLGRLCKRGVCTLQNVCKILAPQLKPAWTKPLEDCTDR